MNTESRPETQFREDQITLMYSKLGSRKFVGDDRKIAKRLMTRIETHPEFNEDSEAGNCQACGHLLSGFTAKARKNGLLGMKVTEIEKQWLVDKWIKAEIRPPRQEDMPPIFYEKRLIKFAATLGAEYERQVLLVTGDIEEEERADAETEESE